MRSEVLDSGTCFRGPFRVLFQSPVIEFQIFRDRSFERDHSFDFPKVVARSSFLSELRPHPARAAANQGTAVPSSSTRSRRRAEPSRDFSLRLEESRSARALGRALPLALVASDCVLLDTRGSSRLEIVCVCVHVGEVCCAMRPRWRMEQHVRDWTGSHSGLPAVSVRSTAPS